MGLNYIPSAERPREKLKASGPSALSDRELLAIILRTGTRKEDVLNMSNSLLHTFNLKQLSRARISALQNILGIGEVKACQIAACFELGRRLARFREKQISIRTAKDIAGILQEEMRSLHKEHLCAVFLNAKRRIMKIENVFIGSLDESVIHPREIFRAAMEESAAAIILVHNHPSGDPTPSSFDIESTRQIINAGKIIGIPIIDHVIIGDSSYISMLEEGMI